MTLSSHPSDETLARYAAASLPAGGAVVVMAHVESCPACQHQVRAMTSVAASLLEDMAPSQLTSSALERTMARLDDHDTASPRLGSPNQLQPRLASTPDGIALPHALVGCTVGRWRSLAPGVQWSRIEVAHQRHPDETVGLMRIGANKEMPAHSHRGSEYTLVLGGSFFDANGHYGVGDFLEADSSLDHQPIADRDRDCLCLTVINGSLRPHDRLTRWLMPFFGL